MTGIADTGFLVAFGNRRDRHHLWAVDQARALRSPLLTCEAVLSEACYLLRDVDFVLDLMERGLFILSFEANDHLAELRTLSKRYADRSPDLADLCLVRMSELNPQLPVWTIDTDFRVYRRNRRGVIPLVMPPDLRT